MKDPWPLERRIRQAEIIRKTKPWERSTGPKSAAGKARVSRNAFQGGQREWFRACAIIFAIFRKHPGATNTSECGPLTARERAAIATYVRLNPSNIPIEAKVRTRRVYVKSTEELLRELNR
jgi:hypothetical protein